ncbi:MAG TPA: hypothetical protein VLB84_01130 [Bacteroidia bacterium]|nr:hypothetical protein [Bacteroidia bacterium]
MVEKQLHIFDHLNDERCIATDKHFHQQEHVCHICEFTLSNSGTLPEIRLTIILSEYYHSFGIYSESKYVPSAFQDLPSRAPPFC